MHSGRDSGGGAAGAVGRHRRPADGQAGAAGDGDTAVAAARAVHGAQGAGKGAAAVRAARQREDAAGQGRGHRMSGLWFLFFAVQLR